MVLVCAIAKGQLHYVTALAAEGGGNYLNDNGVSYVAGVFFGSIDTETGNRQDMGEGDAFLACFVQGQPQAKWVKTIGGPHHEAAAGLRFSEEGSLELSIWQNGDLPLPDGTLLQAQVSGTIDLPERVRPGQEFKVSVNLNKNGISGFAKLDLLIPPGFTVVEDELAGSAYRYKDGKAKFIWMALPASNAFSVSYKLTADQGLSGPQILEGAFSYIDGTDTKKYRLPKAIVMVISDAVASAENNANNYSLSSEQKDADAQVAANDRSRGSVAEETYSNSNYSSSSSDVRSSDVVANTVSSPQQNTSSVRVTNAYKEVEGLVYRVQVLAGYDLRDAQSISSKYGLTEELTVTEHDGMYKYVLGEFNQYRAAKALSNELRNTTALPGPFVVAYKDGYRITTAEALNLLTENLNQLEQIIKDNTSQIGQ